MSKIPRDLLGADTGGLTSVAKSTGHVIAHNLLLPRCYSFVVKIILPTSVSVWSSSSSRIVWTRLIDEDTDREQAAALLNMYISSGFAVKLFKRLKEC